MAGITTLLDVTKLPSRTQDQETFDINMAYLMQNLPKWGGEVNTTLTAMGNLQVGGAADVIPAAIPATTTTKLFRMLTTNTAQIITKGGSYKGYRVMNLLKGLASNTNSAGAPAELWRVGKVWSLHLAYLVKQSGWTTSGTWEDFTVTGTTIGATPGSTASSNFISAKRSTTVGDYIEIPVTVGRSGVLPLGFLMTAAASPVVEILVNGTLRETISTRNANGPFLYEHVLRLAPGDYTIRLRIGTGSTGYLYFVGANFYPLDKAPLDVQAETLYFYNSDQDYVINEGASDYALVDDATGVYSGSYHGGETAASVKWLADGVEFTPAVGSRKLATGFELRQVTTIFNKVTSTTTQRFVADGVHEFNAVLQGPMTLSTIYSGMVTTSDAFTRITFPRAVDMSPMDDLSEVLLGRAPVVQQERPDTGQRTTSYHTIFVKDSENTKGGVFVRKAVGGYNKVYYGIVVGTNKPYALTDLAWRQIRVFD